MQISELNRDDLSAIARLQPEGWQDITPSFRFYLSHSFCSPYKLTLGDEIAGVGATVRHATTSWLGHIIVHPQHRNRGFGTLITNHLISIAKKDSTTISLIATTLGAPVYAKCGFKTEREYIFLQGQALPAAAPASDYDTEFESQMLDLDRKISGEDRRQLLTPHLKNSKLVLSDKKVTGFYMPTLGEGLIVADNEEAGIRLLHEKLKASDNKIVIPLENQTALSYLQKLGYKEFLRGTRMYLGNKILWHPNKLYSRIAGNLG